GCLLPRRLALLRLVIQRLRDRCRPSHIAHSQHFYLKEPGVVLNLQPISSLNLARRLRWASIPLDTPQLTRSRRECPRLVEPCSPKPLIDPYCRHTSSYRWRSLIARAH